MNSLLVGSTLFVLVQYLIFLADPAQTIRQQYLSGALLLLLQKASKKKYSASISGILLYDRVNLSNHMLRNQ
jgi:hypothetical protein